MKTSSIQINQLPLQPEHQRKFFQLQFEVGLLQQQILKYCQVKLDKNTDINVL